MKIELDEYVNLIRKYPAYSILEFLFFESMDIYKNYKNGFKFEIVPLYDKKTKTKIKDYRFDIGQWDLIELGFNSIKYGTDFRNSKVSRDDFYKLLNGTRHISELLENAKEMDQHDLEKHLMCISNMQFDFEIMNIRQKFNRLYQIMIITNNNKKYDQTDKVCYINFRERFKLITGISYDVYLNGYMFLVLFSLIRENNNIIKIIDEIDINKEIFGFNKDDIKSIIISQSKDYAFFKKTDNWNLLKYNPIVKCDRFKDNYVLTNISSLLITFSEFMYWTIRNYYRDINSLDFTNYFGHCFEYYLNDFFDYYNVNYQKLKEDNNKKPDWRIETNKYIFYVEQKASLYPINTRTITIENRIQDFDNYINNNLVEAFTQLNNYEEKTDKIIVRICLTFEQIYITEIVQELTFPHVKNLKNDFLNWLIPINDFEKLFILFSENEEKFNKIIEKKIIMEKEKYNNGRGFDTLLSSIKNTYNLKQINHYDKLLNKMLKKIEKYYEMNSD